MNRERRAAVVAAVIVMAIAAWVYWPAAHNLFLFWDDMDCLKRAMLDRSFTLDRVWTILTSPYLSNYHPLTTLSHALACRLWGMNPAPHHVVNLLLHTINTGLVAAFVWILFGASRAFDAREKLAVAAFVTLAFAIHPLQVESVAWMAELKTLLCASFSLACLIAYVKGARVATAVLFALALLSKAMAVPLPAVMLLVDYYPLRREAKTGWRELVKEKVPLFAMGAVAGVIAIMAQAGRHATMSLQQLSVAARCLVAARGIVFYVWKLFWPVALSPYYPLEGTISLRETEFSVSVVLCVVVSGLAVWQWRRWPGLFVAWFAYLALVTPTSGIVQAGGQAAADRYMYLPLLPLLLGVGWGMVFAWREFTPFGRLALVVMLVCNFTFWGLKTRAQIGVWQDDEALWGAVLAYFPQSARANENMAMALARQGRADEAEPFANYAVQTNPKDPMFRTTRGLINLSRHCYDEALADFEVALRSDPDMVVARYDLACALSRLGRTQDALVALREAVSRDAEYASLAQRDEDLANLRNDPQLAGQLRELTGPMP